LSRREAFRLAADAWNDRCTTSRKDLCSASESVQTLCGAASAMQTPHLDEELEQLYDSFRVGYPVQGNGFAGSHFDGEVA
jgi:hypothetical protein